MNISCKYTCCNDHGRFSQHLRNEMNVDIAFFFRLVDKLYMLR